MSRLECHTISAGKEFLDVFFLNSTRANDMFTHRLLCSDELAKTSDLGETFSGKERWINQENIEGIFQWTIILFNSFVVIVIVFDEGMIACSKSSIILEQNTMDFWMFLSQTIHCWTRDSSIKSYFSYQTPHGWTGNECAFSTRRQNTDHLVHQSLSSFLIVPKLTQLLQEATFIPGVRSTDVKATHPVLFVHVGSSVLFLFLSPFLQCSKGVGRQLRWSIVVVRHDHRKKTNQKQITLQSRVRWFFLLVLFSMEDARLKLYGTGSFLQGFFSRRWIVFLDLFAIDVDFFFFIFTQFPLSSLRIPNRRIVTTRLSQ